MNCIDKKNDTNRPYLVSIIVPAYNEEKNIQNCINKLLNQTYKNIEIIIIDDGSKDLTLSICKLKTTEDKRIKVYTQHNSGVSKARNHGLEIANGEYILFVDADDELLPHAIEAMLHSAVENKVNIVQGCLVHKNNNFHQYTGKNILINSKELLSPILDNRHTLISGLDKHLLYSTHGSYAKLFNKNFLNSNSLRFDTDLVLGEDMMFTLQAYTKSEKICLLDELVYIVFENQNSSTRRLNKKMLPGSVNFINKLNQYLSTENLISDSDVERRYICFWTFFVGINSSIINDKKLQNFFKNINEIHEICKEKVVQQSIVEFLEMYKYNKKRYGRKLFFLAFILHYRMYFLFVTLLKGSLYLNILKNVYR